MAAALAFVLAPAVPAPHAPAALHGADSEAERTAVLSSSTPGWRLLTVVDRCPDGPVESECLDAVQKAAQLAGKRVNNWIKRTDDTNMPYGCSYSKVSRGAIFNSNPDGQLSDNYQPVCRADAPRRTEEKTQVYLLIGQSNMVGRGNAADLTEDEQKRLAAVAPRVKLFYRGTKLDDITHWTVRSEDEPLNVTEAETEAARIFKMNAYFGPELFFGLTMAERNPEQNFELIKVAFPGASLVASFNPDWDVDVLHEVQPECATGSTKFSWCNESFYATTVADVKERMARLGEGNAELAGVLSVQGEKEVRLRRKLPWITERYGPVLKDFIQSLRWDNRALDLPFAMVQTFNGDINNAMQEVADSMENVYLLHDGERGSADHLPRWGFNFRHFDTEGQRRLGTRFAEAMMFMRKLKVPWKSGAGN